MERPWQTAFKRVVGKRIRGVLVAADDRSNRSHVFLIFDDGTHYELYGQDICGRKHIDSGGLDEAKAYIGNSKGIEILLQEPKPES